MKKYESSQVDMTSSSLFQRIKDGIVSPLALKLGFFTTIQPVPSPVNHHSSILKLQKYLKAQEAEANEEIARLEQERKIMMQGLSALHLKIQETKQDFIDMKSEIQELESQLSIEENQNRAIRQEIIRIEQERQQQNLYDEEDEDNEEETIHYSFLGLTKSKNIDKNLSEQDMDEMGDREVLFNPYSYGNRLNINHGKIIQLDSEEDPEMEVQEVD